jgi:hypothetical protein
LSIGISTRSKTSSCHLAANSQVIIAGSSWLISFYGMSWKTITLRSVTLQGVEALAISGCVTASVSGNQICFTIPIFGRFCFTSSVRIPIGAQFKACFQTCGTIIPTGVKVTI